MAKFITNKNADKYVQMLTELCDTNTVRLDMKKAIYPAAGYVADAIVKNINTLPIVNDTERGTANNPIDGVTQWQRTGLLEGFGISKFQDRNGFLNVKLGFDGYNSTTGKNGKKQANVMIARSVESGTSFRKKHPFVAPAVRRSKTNAEKMMADELDKIIVGHGFDAK